MDGGFLTYGREAPYILTGGLTYGRGCTHMDKW